MLAVAHDRQGKRTRIYNLPIVRLNWIAGRTFAWLGRDDAIGDEFAIVVISTKLKYEEHKAPGYLLDRWTINCRSLDHPGVSD